MANSVEPFIKLSLMSLFLVGITASQINNNNNNNNSNLLMLFGNASTCTTTRNTSRGYKLIMYNGGNPDQFHYTGNEQQNCAWLREYAQFACDKALDRVYLNVQDPLAAQRSAPASVISQCFLKALPPWMEAGVVLQVNDKEPWVTNPTIPSMVAGFQFISQVGGSLARWYGLSFYQVSIIRWGCMYDGNMDMV